MFQWIGAIRKWFSLRLHRFLGDRDVREIAGKAVDKTVEAIRRVSNRYSDGQITMEQWRDQVAEEILDGHIQQYLLGRGGIGHMTDADWRTIDELVDRQYTYLERFSDASVAGRITGGAIALRASLYGMAVRAAYAAAVAAGAVGLKRESRWLMSPDKEHCPDCLQYASLGWQKIGVLPVPLSAEANTECLSRCGCFLEYR